MWLEHGAVARRPYRKFCTSNLTSTNLVIVETNDREQLAEGRTMHRKAFSGSRPITTDAMTPYSMDCRTMNAISVSSSTRHLSIRRSFARGAFFMLLAMIAAALLPARAKGQTTLTWDPSQNGTGSDGSGTWDTATLNWGNGGTDTSWPTVSPYANAIIGDGGVLSTSDIITLASGTTLDVGNITFGRVDPTSTAGYTLEGNYGTSKTANTGLVNNVLVLTNTGSTPSALIDNTAPSITTNVQTVSSPRHLRSTSAARAALDSAGLSAAPALQTTGLPR